jgi:hypothetical protein
MRPEEVRSIPPRLLHTAQMNTKLLLLLTLCSLFLPETLPCFFLVRKRE